MTVPQAVKLLFQRVLLESKVGRLLIVVVISQLQVLSFLKLPLKLLCCLSHVLLSKVVENLQLLDYLSLIVNDLLLLFNLLSDPSNLYLLLTGLQFYKSLELVDFLLLH